MRNHEQFEWDVDKAESNFRKHRVRFTDAAAVLADEAGDRFQIDVVQDEYQETRWKTYASDPMDRSLVIVVAWTEREDVTRIISARLATPKERRFYEQIIARA